METVSRPSDGILRGREYFLVLMGLNSFTPVVPSFHNWRFPHGRMAVKERDKSCRMYGFEDVDPFSTQYDFEPTFEDRFKYKWRYERFGYQDPASIFTTLSEQYNTFQCRLQSHRAFYFDIGCIALEATDVYDFLQRMAIRQKERFTELRDMYLVMDYDVMRNKKRMNN
ncbi:hypothetical protein MCOR16_008442 [Pyricularia oryzae]|nr:hypothetical protein MCOR16_008442 [Pyricularia oryzae]